MDGFTTRPGLPGLLVGLEDAADLLADVAPALAVAHRAG
jgi:cystathionine beta-lyase/cystathionine gamma-synthase